ncbi:MAG: phosphoribosylanthranilate isomerase [Muribaculaceae bacterium]|nr:phosphoribosylanthranilate isomerase [Muribaculaceae bacterium]
MKIKVCGMKDAENIKEVTALGPDYMGFIFYERSPRYCGGMAPAVVKGLPDNVKPVMVSVDMTEDEIMRIAERYGFGIVQLHGHELPELCFSLRSRGLKVVKAAGMRSASNLDILREYGGAVDAFLLDTLCAAKGGSGRKFDWSILDAYDLPEDFYLSGGIGPQDVESVKQLHHPRFVGIDLNSRFETSPGIKDVDMLRKFINEIKTA